LTSTAIGLLSLEAIAFSVETSVLGLQGLNARPATVANLDVFHGFPTYLQINGSLLTSSHSIKPPSDAPHPQPTRPCSTPVTSPSALETFSSDSSSTDRSLEAPTSPASPLFPESTSSPPLSTTSPSETSRLLPDSFSSRTTSRVRLDSQVSRAATDALPPPGVTSDTIIVGTADTTPIDSLKAALGSIKLATSIPALQQNLITQASLILPLDIAETSIAGSTFILDNPFTANINLLSVVANASYEGLFLGQINVPSINPPIFAPGKTVTNAPNLPYVPSLI
jgi:hypothetical protein